MATAVHYWVYTVDSPAPGLFKEKLHIWPSVKEAVELDSRSGPGVQRDYLASIIL